MRAWRGYRRAPGRGGLLQPSRPDTRRLDFSPSTKADTRSGALFNHYSMLATAEQLLGLPKLGLAAAYPTMTKAFNL